MSASIYKITNKVNNKSYIGFTTNPKKRWYKHIWSSTHDSCLYIHNTIRKYGIKNFTFEVIYQSWDVDHCLNVMEPYFIKLYRSYWKTGNGYNLTLGGEGVLGHTVSEKLKLEISKRNTGRKYTPEQIRRMSDNRMGYRHSEETKRKIGLGNKGKIMPIEDVIKRSQKAKLLGTFAGKNNPMFGKKHTNETKKRMSKNHADVSGKNNPMFGANRSGEKNGMFGKKHKESTREKIKQSWISRKLKKQMKNLTNQNCDTNPTVPDTL